MMFKEPDLFSTRGDLAPDLEVEGVWAENLWFFPRPYTPKPIHFEIDCSVSHRLNLSRLLILLFDPPIPPPGLVTRPSR